MSSPSYPISKQVSQNAQQSSPTKDASPPSSPNRPSVTGISLEVDSRYAYDDIITSLPLRAIHLDSGSSTSISLTNSIDYILRPSPYTHASIASFHNFLTSPECMTPHPPLFRNHVKNYTLLYYAQSATQLVYLIRSNYVSYPVEHVLTFKWTASVFSARPGEREGDWEMEEYGVRGRLLVEIRGAFKREKGQGKVQWEELIASILKILSGVKRISAENAKRMRKGKGENAVRERAAQGMQRNEIPLRVLDFKENIFNVAYPNL